MPKHEIDDDGVTFKRVASVHRYSVSSIVLRDCKEISFFDWIGRILMAKKLSISVLNYLRFL